MNSNFDLKKIENKTIIFIDGECIMCNQFLTYIFNRDKKSLFYASSLQSHFALKYLNKKITSNLNSIIVALNFNTHNQIILKKSNAIFFILSQLGGIYNLINIFKILPSNLCDTVYDFISKRRQQFLIRTKTCDISQKKFEKKII
ncbi:hypothetical protein DID74_00320 [Candidatus Marinamargulisbacteria bacterium SCGC AG-333-B06]|nr:hypothetical protein DID74_00320 [Candidatus Marinamargulisbacteria bacterium SCGC AG-333-B06]